MTSFLGILCLASCSSCPGPAEPSEEPQFNLWKVSTVRALGVWSRLDATPTTSQTTHCGKQFYVSAWLGCSTQLLIQTWLEALLWQYLVELYHRKLDKMKWQRNMSWTKEQDKTPEKQLSEVDISKLPEKEFRIMIVKMIQDLRKRIKEQTNRDDQYNNWNENYTRRNQ